MGGEGFRGDIFFVGEDPFKISEKPLNFVVISEILSAENHIIMEATNYGPIFLILQFCSVKFSNLKII